MGTEGYGQENQHLPDFWRVRSCDESYDTLHAASNHDRELGGLQRSGWLAAIVVAPMLHKMTADMIANPSRSRSLSGRMVCYV